MTVAKIGGAVVYKFDSEEVAKSAVETITNELLQGREFKECGKHDSIKAGFSPFSEDNFLLQTANTTAVQISTQTKKVHSEELKRKCKKAELKHMEDYGVEEVSKEDKEEIKHRMTEEMLPDTPAGKIGTVALWITGNTLTVGVGNYKKGEEAVSMLRGIVGSIPVTPLEVPLDVADKLTDMVTKGYGETVVLADKVELLEEDGKNTITFAKGSIYDKDTGKHIKDGATVSKVQMEFDGSVLFTTNTELELSGIKIDKRVLDGQKDVGALIVSMDELDKLGDELVSIFGGVKTEEGE